MRAILATGSYVLGASLQIVLGMALRLYLGLGIIVAGITFVVEYLANIRPTRHLARSGPRHPRRNHDVLCRLLARYGWGASALAHHGPEKNLAMVLGTPILRDMVVAGHGKPARCEHHLSHRAGGGWRVLSPENPDLCASRSIW
jgi:hypothetical protein